MRKFKISYKKAVKSAKNAENLSQKETLIMPEYDLYINHAYCVKKYNKETGTVVLSNPHDTRYSIEVPLSIIEKYIINCEVSSV